MTSGQRVRLLRKAARGRLHDKRTYGKDAKLAVGRLMRESVPTAQSSGAAFAFIARHISFVRLIQATSQTEKNRQNVGFAKTRRRIEE